MNEEKNLFYCIEELNVLGEPMLRSNNTRSCFNSDKSWG